MDDENDVIANIREYPVGGRAYVGAEFRRTSGVKEDRGGEKNGMMNRWRR